MAKFERAIFSFLIQWFRVTPKLINLVATLDEIQFERVLALLYTPIMIWVATDLVQLLYDGKIEK